ncbi:hypothetical protein [Fortiea contorta]|uniref:hypothetical protein n=1 Tax=Fortiea contorta TaxID=1892405 RepID=UPI00034A3988|nr:hypothetical protein [Fortiea contorta]
MKFNAKIAVALFAISAGIFGVSSQASAGEGAAAGSAAFSVDSNGKITGAAVSAAVGKNNAAATATNVSVGAGILGINVGFTSNTATAVGSAGALTVTAKNSDELGNINISGVVGEIKADGDTQPSTTQNNSLNAKPNLNYGDTNLVKLGQ